MLRIQFSILPAYIGGQAWSDGLIEINLATVHPNRRRYMISTFVHEFTHLVIGWLCGWPANPYESYCHEIWCYRAQWIAERVMLMTRIVDVEDGIMSSVRVFTRRMIKVHQMNEIISEVEQP